MGAEHEIQLIRPLVDDEGVGFLAPQAIVMLICS